MGIVQKAALKSPIEQLRERLEDRKTALRGAENDYKQKQLQAETAGNASYSAYQRVEEIKDEIYQLEVTIDTLNQSPRNFRDKRNPPKESEYSDET